MPNWRNPRFDWDDGNVDKIIDRHDVYPLEAEEVFFDRNVLIYRDGRRYRCYGRTMTGRLLFIVCEDRRGRIRVISARDMDADDRRFYARNS